MEKNKKGIQDMSRKIKILGLACVAVFALTAASASSAMASSAFTVATGGTKIEGVQSTAQKLTLAEGVTVKCTTSTLTAPVSAGTVTEATATPTYSGCTLAGLSATIETHSCTYTITNTGTALTFNADVTNCPSGSGIVIKNSGCTVTILNQGPLSSITAANVAATPPHVTATLGVGSIAYTGGSGCPSNVVGSHTGTLEGGYTLKAFNSAGTQVGLSAD
jgi:hypothetical protein